MWGWRREEPRKRKQNQCWCCCCLLSPGQPRDEGFNSIWSHLTFHVSQSRSWQHSGTIDLQLANILMCTGVSFNQLLSQPFPVYFSVKVCSCEKVSLSRFLCWQEGAGTAVSVFKAQGHRYRQTLHLPGKLSFPSRVSRPRQGQGIRLWLRQPKLCSDWAALKSLLWGGCEQDNVNLFNHFSAAFVGISFFKVFGEVKIFL